MSRTYRRMKTERAIRAPRRELRKNKRTWKESRERSIDLREMSSVEHFDF
jgi:hypothetical protein